MDYLFKLDNQDLIEPITEDLEGWRVIEGEPTMKTWIMRTSNDGSMISGVWTATPGTYHAVYAEYEFVHLIEGSITITPDGGEPAYMSVSYTHLRAHETELYKKPNKEDFPGSGLAYLDIIIM